MPAALQPMFLLAVEATIVIALILGLFRLRHVLGRTPLFVAIGALQYMQVILAASLYVEIFPGVWVSPGSAVLFMATLTAVLLIYIEMDASETRKLIYGLVAASLTIAVLSFSYAQHVGSPFTENLFDLPRSFFFQNLRVMLVGTLTLFLDAVLLIIFFEWVSKLTDRLFLRLLATLAAVALLDSVLFVTGAFSGQENWWALLGSALIGKAIFALFYAAALWLYVTRAETRFDDARETAAVELRDVFSALTYRQKYEIAREEALRDSLTGLYNRRFFEESLKREMDRARRDESSVVLLLVDLNRFKAINDRYGHPAGDKVLRATGRVLERAVRASDAASRIGGDEFSVLLPRAGLDGAGEIAIRLAAEIGSECREAAPEIQEEITVTIGLAAYPEDAASADEMFQHADRRLYRGKLAGGTQVVTGEA